jgi:hypothetical protein
MEYTYLPIENTDLFELRAENFIFILDSADPMYDKMIEDFNKATNIKKFISLLIADPSTAFDIYNASN